MKTNNNSMALRVGPVINPLIKREVNMSVMLHSQIKYYRIAKTLKDYNEFKYPCGYQGDTGRLGQFFGYPEEWKTYEGLDYNIKVLCEDLYFANQRAWNEQYPNHRVKLNGLDFGKIESNQKPYKNLTELLKSLHSVHYNLYTNNGDAANINGIVDRLEKLTAQISYDVIALTPEFKTADVWSE